MGSSRMLLISLLQFLSIILPSLQGAPSNQKLFREYIGAEENNVKFSDVPINSDVEFHFILSFAIDYIDSTSPPSPTNGNFNVFWDDQNLTPYSVSSIKAQHSNVKVALSLGGDTVGGKFAYFKPASTASWVKNAFESITRLVREYDLDGIDIDYEHFAADSHTFTECIGQLLLSLKQHKVISFASIAPFNDDTAQFYYSALWRKYGYLIDYVNFQFYSYDKGTTVHQFVNHFETQSSIYHGGKVIASFGTDGSGGLSPENGFFKACSILRRLGKLHGIFIWSADDSKKDNFLHEKQAQSFLAQAK